jgi:hypothetical protein
MANREHPSVHAVKLADRDAMSYGGSTQTEIQQLPQRDHTMLQDRALGNQPLQRGPWFETLT